MRVCGRGGVAVVLWRVEDLLERLEDGDAVGEHPVRQEERVQEVDVEEAQVGQALQLRTWFLQVLDCCRALILKFVVLVQKP